MFDIPIEDFDDRTLKELPNKYWGVSPRKFAQECGTGFARELFGENVWIRRLEKNEKFAARGRRVVTDVRFDNEAEWLRNQGGQLWHVTGRSVQGVRSHVSESGVRVRDGDVRFDNGGDFESCQRTTKQLALSLLHYELRVSQG